MIFFRQKVLTQIKSASGEQEIQAVIDHSIQRLKIKNVNGHIIQRFVTQMGSILQLAKTETQSDKIKVNVAIAIDRFRKHQKA